MNKYVGIKNNKPYKNIINIKNKLIYKCSKNETERGWNQRNNQTHHHHKYIYGINKTLVIQAMVAIQIIGNIHLISEKEKWNET